MGWDDLRLELGRAFVMEAICPQCDRHIELDRALCRLRDVDAICPICKVTCPTCGFVCVGQPDCPNCGQVDINELRLETFHTLSADDPTTEPFLDYSLTDLGIPPLHILTVRSGDGQRVNVELTGDLPSLWS